MFSGEDLAFIEVTSGISKLAKPSQFAPPKRLAQQRLRPREENLVGG